MQQVAAGATRQQPLGQRVTMQRGMQEGGGEANPPEARQREAGQTVQVAGVAGES